MASESEALAVLELLKILVLDPRTGILMALLVVAAWIDCQNQSHSQSVLARSQHSGPAPVSLKAYVDQVQKQSVANTDLNRERLHNVFSGIVIKERLLAVISAADVYFSDRLRNNTTAFPSVKGPVLQPTRPRQST